MEAKAQGITCLIFSLRAQFPSFSPTQFCILDCPITLALLSLLFFHTVGLLEWSNRILFENFQSTETFFILGLKPFNPTPVYLSALLSTSLCVDTPC